MMNTVHKLPEPCQLKILGFLRLNDLLVCRSVSHSWKAMVSTHWDQVAKKVSIPMDLPASWNFNGSGSSTLKILDQLGPNLTNFSYVSTSEETATKFLTKLTAKFPTLQRLALKVPVVKRNMNHILQFTQLRSLTLLQRLDVGWPDDYEDDQEEDEEDEEVDDDDESLLGSWFGLFPQSFKFLRELCLVNMRFVLPTNTSSKWTSLEAVVLYQVDVTDYSDFCSFISNCPKLVTLSLHCRIPDLEPPCYCDTDQLMLSIPASLRILYLAEQPDGWWENIKNFRLVWRRFPNLEELVLMRSIFKLSIRGDTGSRLKSPTISSLQKLSIVNDGCTVGEVKTIASGCFQLTHLNLNLKPGFRNGNVLILLIQNQPKLESLHLYSERRMELEDAGFLEEIALRHRSLAHVYLGRIGFPDQGILLKSIINQLASEGSLGSGGIKFPAMERWRPLRLHFLESRLSNADKIELLADTRAEGCLQLRFCEAVWMWPCNEEWPYCEGWFDYEYMSAILGLRREIRMK